MCGILGFITEDKKSYSEAMMKFDKALKLMIFRGPDQSFILKEKPFILGFNRLSITGGNKGKQPISNKQKSCYLVCNGEIYNSKQLKRTLKKNHSFSTTSDCEIILHLYEEIGFRAFTKLKGQFSFALIDKRNREIYLVRDRFGIHPLYFHKLKKGLIFSSTIKSLQAIKKVSSELDIVGLIEGLLLYGPTFPRSYFKNISQVPPASFYQLNWSSGKSKICKYWQPSPFVLNKVDNAQEEFEHLLIQAIKRRLQGSGKPGVFLSGGIDSSTISYYLAKILNATPTAFSIYFNNKKFDESIKQKLIADYLNIPLIQILGDDSNYLDYLKEIIWHLEGPLIRGAPIPLYFLSKQIHNQGIKFALCGEGADEFLLGYPVFSKRIASVENKFNSLKTIEKLINPKFNINFSDIYNNFLDNFNHEFKSFNLELRMQFLEINTKLSRYLLSNQGDRTSMSHSVEQRFPFLDEDLVDFLIKLPHDLKINKQILKNLMQDKIPSRIVRSSKQGYLTPDKLIFNPRKNSYKDLFKNSSIFNSKYFNQKYLNNTVNQYAKTSSNNVNNITMIFSLTTSILHDLFFA